MCFVFREAKKHRQPGKPTIRQWEDYLMGLESKTRRQTTERPSELGKCRYWTGLGLEQMRVKVRSQGRQQKKGDQKTSVRGRVGGWELLGRESTQPAFSQTTQAHALKEPQLCNSTMCKAGNYEINVSQTTQGSHSKVTKSDLHYKNPRKWEARPLSKGDCNG